MVGLLAVSFLITGGLALAGSAPSLVVKDQSAMEGKITIPEVVSEGPGWLVIHIQSDGKPGAVIGYSFVSPGVNKNLIVEIDAGKATDTLYAMLHADAGAAGTYEFPGPDSPVTVGGKTLVKPFKIATTSGAEIYIDVKGFAFVKREVVVAPGTRVTWKNSDSAPHTVTAEGGLFDSGNMKKGDVYSYVFTNKGEYPYYCRYHRRMIGKIIVGARESSRY